MSVRCVVLLGGSFDPVHVGHTALARYFCTLLQPDELRLIPAGQPWQKPSMVTPAEHRIAMLRAAFRDWVVPVVIDTQEVQREGPSYAVDTLRALRSALGDAASLIMLLGADQLQNLHTWRDWQDLFELVNVGVGARPGYPISAGALSTELASEFLRRRAPAAQLRASPCGLAYIAQDLNFDVSSTTIRAAFAAHDERALGALLPAPVLDYAQQHHLYQTAN